MHSHIPLNTVDLLRLILWTLHGQIVQLKSLEKNYKYRVNQLARRYIRNGVHNFRIVCVSVYNGLHVWVCNWLNATENWKQCNEHKLEPTVVYTTGAERYVRACCGFHLILFIVCTSCFFATISMIQSWNLYKYKLWHKWRKKNTHTQTIDENSKNTKKNQTN